jgi:acyl-CoA thioester hydrolase
MTREPPLFDVPDDVPFPVELELPVLWGQMDALGHVNNTVYFRYFESARIDYLRRLGMLAGKEQGTITPILASTRCDFLRPLTFPDQVVVGARVARIGRTSFTMHYRITSRAQGQVAARGEGVLVLLDPRSGRPVEVDPSIREAIDRLEANRARHE